MLHPGSLDGLEPARDFLNRAEQATDLGETTSCLRLDSIGGGPHGHGPILGVRDVREKRREAACVGQIEVEWEPLAVVTDAGRAVEPGAARLDDDAPENLVADISFAQGDVDSLFETADHTFSKRLHAQRHYAAALENDGVLASYENGTGELTVWSTTQMPHPTRSLIAELLGIPSARVRFICREMGGGFGSRARISVEEAIIPALSRLVGRPVKWIGDRYESLSGGVHAKEMVVELSLAVQDGKLTAGRADVCRTPVRTRYFRSPQWWMRSARRRRCRASTTSLA
jgi:CO/xanthine dehydrogenase Mo-binding subunit